MTDFENLWPLPCPEVVVITGRYGSGKSTLALSSGAPMDRIIALDYEKSLSSFAEQLKFECHDMQEILGEKFPKGYKAIDIYNETCAIMDQIPPNLYDVIVLDNASPLEDGILAYVESHAQEFGHSPGQYQSMSGLKWGDVKTKYSQLLTRWVSKVKMIMITVHLRDKWAGSSVVKDEFGKPVQEPKGKETLEMLSSLFVWLDTGPGGIPSARVLKCRVDRKVFVNDPKSPPDFVPAEYLAELHGEPGLVSIPVLPLRLPKCTWPSIREYMRHPANLNKPAPGERPSDKELSDDDRLRLRSIISQNNAEIAAVDKMKVEAGEPKTQGQLVTFAKSLGMTPAEVAEALKKEMLVPFNPDNWERMKQAVRTFAENKVVA